MLNLRRLLTAVSRCVPMDHRATFEAQLKPHLERLYRLAFRLTGAVEDAEDLLQDVLIKLYRRRAELTSIGDLGPWLARVLYNRFIDDQRRRRVRHLRLVTEARDDGAAVDQVATELPGPENQAQIDGDIILVRKALAKLSPEHRAVLLMHDAEGYKLEEIHRVTGLPVGTVKSRLTRARARLRGILDQDGTF